MTTFRLHLRIENHWQLFLEIPASELALLALRPLKWLRYIGYGIYGQHGWLSTTPGGSKVAADAGTVEDYYYVSTSPACFIDINALNDRTSNASQRSVRTTWFRRDMILRDQSCLVTGAPEQDCQACHLLPHSKGDAYISAISNLRAGDEAPVTEIGDIRNGVLLYKGLHDVLGDGKIAFMPTPNPYLLPEDIPSRDPLAAPPPTRRLTLQHIYPLVGPNLLIAPHNHDIRVISHNMEPSAYLMHFFYACAILQRWGKSSRVYLLDEDIQDAYYDCKTPFASPVEPKFPKQTHPTAGSSHHGATSSTENRSLSDVMDELLLLHSIWHSREPTDVPDVTGKVLSWLEEADQSHLASNSTAHIISS